ncbi:DUF1569 domain-containing protein [Noviherbaspirillum galbum]|uniref:DUF1569 domain-containing protein n=1 Tax=Noviherbaspirillum galbum TaxID=2709383 RepID=A0A6B3SRU7_9BURK|nr:DUF1569 domain-containing protein [Noviherbaspirillum galbum]NEX63238.1 DUF1569 domain-containing protein [Noviherbaspirillum galbum]
MQRRTLITGLAGGIVAAAGVALLWPRRDAQALTIVALLPQLDALAAAPVRSTGAWTPFQIFSHCAQTAEYALTGFPVQKSKLFQDSVGKTAFAAFSVRRAMKHGLAEPIEGAPALPGAGTAAQGIARLRQSLLAFSAHQGSLQPHFAYGALEKRDYEAALVLHVHNHLEEIRT